MSNIQSEFGGAPPTSITEYYAGGEFVPANIAGFPANIATNVPSSNSISISNFYGIEIGTYEINANVVSATIGTVIGFAVNSKINNETLYFTIEDLNPVYSWSGPTTILEGATGVYTLSATGYVPNGTVVSYSISGNGITSGDFVGMASLNGNLTMVNNQATLTLVTVTGDGPEGQETFTISTNVGANISSNLGSGEAITYTLTADKSPPVSEGEIVTWTVTTTGVTVGTNIAFTLSNVSVDDIETVDGYSLDGLSGNITIGGDATGRFRVEIFPDYLTELLPENITITLTSIAPTISNTLAISDTSITTSGTATLSGLTGTLTALAGSSELPRAPLWMMFRMIGAGGGGGGADDMGLGGEGSAGTLIRGVLRLPRTRSNKILYGGVGQKGTGGTSYTNAGQESGIGALGGIGYTFSPSGVSGGNGGIGGLGVFGYSGGGGGGGGSTAIAYRLQSNLAATFAIAVASGGAGGGGGTLRRSGGDARINGGVFANVGLGGVGGAGSVNPADGGGGGGGGGGGQSNSPAQAGLGGNFGTDNISSSQGGINGLNLRNNGMTFEYWEVSEPSQATVNIVSNPAALNDNYFGLGGAGGTIPNRADKGGDGSQGAIAVYWTTAVTAPTDWNLLPRFSAPTAVIPLVNQSIINNFGGAYAAYIRFLPNGNFQNSQQEFPNYTGATVWIGGPGVNAVIGNLYEIRATIMTITPGASSFSPSAIGNYYSSGEFGAGSQVGQWLSLGAGSGRVWYLDPSPYPGALANVKIEIRGVGSATVLKTVFYNMTSIYDDTNISGGDSGGGGPD